MLRRILIVAAGVVIAAVVGSVALTWLGEQPHQQADGARFCFAEWCLVPQAIVPGVSTTTVRVEVSSTAAQAVQRPDHPQAWLLDGAGRMAGGPATALDGEIGPGARHVTDLSFDLEVSGCATFLVAEGAWPPALGLGYAPGPFTERASWSLCP